MKMRLACPVLVALLVGLAAGAVAQPDEPSVVYGVHTLAGDAAVRVPDPAWVCVRAPGGADVTLRHEAGAEDALLLFLYDPEGAACRTLTGGGLLAGNGTGPVRVLVLPEEPVERHGPGVVRLGGAGSAIRIEDVGQEATVGVLSQSVGTRAQIVDAATLEVLAEAVDAEERAVQGDAVAGRDVIVLVRDAVVESSILARWEDPDWYARNPSVGVVAAVVAAGLFLVLFRARPRA